MTSSVKKGNQYEGEVKKYLERCGWVVEGQHRKVMFLGPGRMIMAGRDIFGCDLIAKKKGEKTRWIQVSTVANKSSKLKQVVGGPWNFNIDSVELWLRYSGKKRYGVYKLDEDLHTSEETIVDINGDIDAQLSSAKTGSETVGGCSSNKERGTKKDGDKTTSSTSTASTSATTKSGASGSNTNN